MAFLGISNIRRVDSGRDSEYVDESISMGCTYAAESFGFFGSFRMRKVNHTSRIFRAAKNATRESGLGAAANTFVNQAELSRSGVGSARPAMKRETSIDVGA